MDKFNVLHHNRRFLSTALQIDVDGKKDERRTPADRFFTSPPVLFVLFILFSMVLSSAVRLHNDSYDFTAKLAAALVLVAMSQATTILLDTGMNMQNIVTFYRKLQIIVDKKGINLSEFRGNKIAFSYQ